MDRRLAGTLAISVVLSTMISLQILPRTEDEPAKVVVNAFPQNLPWGRHGTPRFVTDVVTTRNLPDLILRYSVLKRVHPALLHPWNETSLPPEELWKNVQILEEMSKWLDRCTDEGLELPVAEEQIDVEQGKVRGDLYVLDYTDAFKTMGAGPGQLNGTSTVWAFLIDPSGNISTFAGIRDFFFERLRLVYSFEISDEHGSASFVSDRVPEELRRGAMGIGLIPPEGTIHAKDLTAGARIHVLFQTMSERMFVHEGILQLIEIETGYGRRTLANLIFPP